MIVELTYDLHTWACLVGLLLSVYALYVEKRKHADSRYSVGFGLVGKIFGKDHIFNQPNCLIGIVYYISQIVLAYTLGSLARLPLLLTSIVGCIGSVYLAYILAFKLKDLCVVCVSTYVVNALIFYSIYHSY